MCFTRFDEIKILFVCFGLKRIFIWILFIPRFGIQLIFSTFLTTEGSALKINWLILVSFFTSMIDHFPVFDVEFWTVSLFRIDDSSSEASGIHNMNLAGLERSLRSMAMIIAPSHSFKPPAASMSFVLYIFHIQKSRLYIIFFHYV